MALDAFLYLDGLAGEATTKGFEGWIQLDSFSWGAHQAVNVGASQGLSAGKATFEPFKITKRVDKSSAKLFLACCQGTHFQKAKLYMRKAAGKDALQYLKCDFNTVFVSNIETIAGSDSAGDETPLESIEFVYGAVQLTYTPQKVDGTADAAIVVKYDMKAATGG
jgi:type VI secretion system secreted protein Hcp